MSDVLGLPHIGDVLGNIGDFFLDNVLNNYINPGVPGATLPVLPAPGGGTVVANPCPGQKYEIVTTVNPDGTTSTVTRKKTRKRRRRLATVSDIRDLAALKSILGGGKVFEAWIATRGR